ncbi:hypothetical protein CSUI_010851, partial [Cystoisospora suis]
KKNLVKERREDEENGLEDASDRSESSPPLDSSSSSSLSFYHADWPYVLPKSLSSSSSSFPFSKRRKEGEERQRGAPVSLVDRARCFSFYRLIWRSILSGRLLQAESLAVQRGASWLVEVLRGDDAWLEPYVPFDGSLSSSSSSFSSSSFFRKHPYLFDILTNREVVLLSDSNSLL